MNSVIEFIMANYTWIVVGLIIILLAIIGGYADKTNFGQGKSKSLEENTDNNENNLNQQSILPVDNNNQKVDEKINNVEQVNSSPIVYNGTVQNSENSQGTQNIQTDQSIHTMAVNNNLIDVNNRTINVENIDLNKSSNEFKDFNDKFDKFDEEFNSVLPKKDIIDDSLLDDIDNLSLDKTQKLDLSIPDLDDVELPRISSLETEQKKIWKK